VKLRAPVPAWFHTAGKAPEPLEVAIDGPEPAAQQKLMKYLGAGVAMVGKVVLPSRSAGKLRRPSGVASGDQVDVILYHPPVGAEGGELVSSQRTTAFRRASFVILCYRAENVAGFKKFMHDTWGVRMDKERSGSALARSTKRPYWAKEPIPVLPDWVVFRIVTAQTLGSSAAVPADAHVEEVARKVKAFAHADVLVDGVNEADIQNIVASCLDHYVDKSK